MIPLANRPPTIKPVAARPVSRTATFPAPRRGWVRNENLARHKPEGAAVLDNWFPTATGVRARRGSRLYATVGTGTAVSSLMVYANGATRKFFAANASSIYEITSVASPTVSPSALVSGLNGGEWSTTMFATAGGVFLIAANGIDTRRVYDGTSWATAPSITATGLVGGFSHVWSFKQRLFFIERDTLNAWYLPVDAIGGTATKLSLGGVFVRGGSLLFGATWSYESTGGGLADACVFVTTEGEAAIYEGTNPGDANAWNLRGVYRLGRPLGKRSYFKAGGDLVVATDIGLIPVSAALSRDQAALSEAAVSYAIEEDWKAEVLVRRDQSSWSVEMWPTQQMAIVQMPSYGSLAKICFVVNIRTGAWARYTNWDQRCLGLFGDRMFFGTSDGRVMEAEVGGSDNGAIYTATYVGLFEDLGNGAATKNVHMARPTILASVPVSPQISISTDYVVTLPLPPSVAPALSEGSIWNAAIWNVSSWAEAPSRRRDGDWQSVAGTGYSIAPNLQLSISGSVEPEIELVQVDLMYETGTVM